MLVLWQRVLPYITSAQSGVTFKFCLTCYLVIIKLPKCQGKKAVCLKCPLLLHPKFGFNPICRWQHQSMLSKTIHKVEVFKYYKCCKDSLHISPNGYFLDVCASFMLARANIQLAQQDNRDKTGSLAEYTENIHLPLYDHMPDISRFTRSPPREQHFIENVPIITSRYDELRCIQCTTISATGCVFVCKAGRKLLSYSLVTVFFFLDTFQ